MSENVEKRGKYDLLTKARFTREVLRDPRLSRSEVVIILLLSDMVDKVKGECWPGLEMISKNTACSVRGCQKSITKLIEKKLLRRVRAGNGRVSALYRVEYDAYVGVTTETPNEMCDTESTSEKFIVEVNVRRFGNE